MEDDVREAIVAHANEFPREEVCGLVVIPHGKRTAEVVRCTNTAEDKRHYFRLSPDDYAAAAERGEIAAVYHSHPETSPEATEADKACAEGLGIPFIIYAPWRASWCVYGPSGYVAEYVNRPYVFGVLDCFALYRDYHAQEIGVELPNVYREPGFWRKGLKLWEPLLPENGFTRVDRIQKHDSLLFALNPGGTNNGAIINHCAIYLGDGLMLHHPSERTSRIEPYVQNAGYYVKHLTGIYRHSSQF